MDFLASDVGSNLESNLPISNRGGSKPVIGPNRISQISGKDGLLHRHLVHPIYMFLQAVIDLHNLINLCHRDCRILGHSDYFLPLQHLQSYGRDLYSQLLFRVLEQDIIQFPSSQDENLKI